MSDSVRIAMVIIHIAASITTIPNKQKPVKNTRLFGVFHTSDPSLSRDNSRVVNPTNKTQVFNEISIMENWLIIYVINSRTLLVFYSW